MNRESIMSAIFSRVSTAANFAMTSRRLKLWNAVAAADKPALFMVERGDFYTHSSEAVPEMVTLHVDLYIYTDAGQDQSAVPATTLNGLIDSVENALKPDVLTGKQTLNNNVSHCWIEGRIMKDAGDLDGQGVAVVPIRVLVPR